MNFVIHCYRGSYFNGYLLLVKGIGDRCVVDETPEGDKSALNDYRNHGRDDLLIILSLNGKWCKKHVTGSIKSYS